MLHDWLLAPLLEFSFMRYGLMVVVLIGLTTSVLSCFLVVKRQSLMGDAVAHSVLLGVVIGWLIGQEAGIFAGAMVAGLLTASAITFVERNSRIRFDAALGIVFTFAFALALAIISMVKPKGIDLFHVLLGNVLAVGPSELLTTALCCVVVILLLVIFFKGYHFWSFDPVGAHAAGLPTAWFHYTFTAMLAATIVVSIQAVGVVLVVALLVTPGATANLLTERLKPMLWVAAGLGITACVVGLYASYYIDVASGPAIVVIASLLFFLSFLFVPRKGLLARWWARHEQARMHACEDALRVLLVQKEEQAQHWRIDELARYMSWTLRMTQQVVRRMQKMGWLRALHPQLLLTSEGAVLGRQLVRKHRLLELYLHDKEGVALEQVHEVADAMEHDVSEQDVASMDSQLGAPSRDPHGHPIPAAHLTTTQLARDKSQMLWNTAVGSAVRVLSLCDSNRFQLTWVIENGLLPGLLCRVVSRDEQGIGVTLNGAAVQVPKQAAQNIKVSALQLLTR